MRMGKKIIQNFIWNILWEEVTCLTQAYSRGWYQNGFWTDCEDVGLNLNKLTHCKMQLTVFAVIVFTFGFHARNFIITWINMHCSREILYQVVCVNHRQTLFAFETVTTLLHSLVILTLLLFGP